MQAVSGGRATNRSFRAIKEKENKAPVILLGYGTTRPLHGNDVGRPESEVNAGLASCGSRGEDELPARIDTCTAVPVAGGRLTAVTRPNGPGVSSCTSQRRKDD
ncbi:hypothetical protein ACOMHN_049970 [Nucella lapillus]